MTRRFGVLPGILLTAGLLFAADLPDAQAGTPRPAAAEPGGKPQSAASQPLELRAGTGILLQLPQTAAAMMSAQPEIARVQPASPASMFLMGVAPGRTTVIATAANGTAIVVYDVTVLPGSTPPPSGQTGGLLQGMPAVPPVEKVTSETVRAIEVAVAQMVPGSDVRVRAAGTNAIISGTVPNAGATQQAMTIARAYVGTSGSVVNGLTTLDSIQVNVRVRFAEIDRSITRQLGFNWQALGGNSSFAFGLLTGAATNGTINALKPLGLSALSGSSSAPYQVGGAFGNKNWDVNGVIDALAGDQLISILAEPNLTAQSGETASFLAGGEFPIPIASSNSSGSGATITVAFKQYGVSLAVVPTVLSPQRLNLRVRPEVSQLSNTGAVSVPMGNGTLTIPALTVRRAETTIELGSGQSFAIAGLLEKTSSNANNGLPFLGDVPVLGPLFRSNDFQQGETELVIIVTPYLVKPAPGPSALSAPTDNFHPATDLQRILLGRQLAAGSSRDGGGQPVDAGFILK